MSPVQGMDPGEEKAGHDLEATRLCPIRDPPDKKRSRSKGNNFWMEGWVLSKDTLEQTKRPLMVSFVHIPVLPGI